MSHRQTHRRDVRNESNHQHYLDSLAVPSLERIEAIAETQEKKEKEARKGYEGVVESRGEKDGGTMTTEEDRRQAASKIQRNYRGYRTRRELQGLSLDPSTRWTEAVREAQYRNLTRPRPKAVQQGVSDEGRKSTDAKRNWHHASEIAKHAHGPMSATQSEVDTEKIPKDKRKMFGMKENEAWKGKAMDLPYFLEMVDLKHRYGSNLRAYHAEWQKSDTHENYFYWLDHGEGRNVELPNVSRARLEREQVRYLSREERMQYLVIVDDEGRLCWAKNGRRIDTSIDYRDSIEGIVPAASNAKVFREDELKELADSVKPREAAKEKQASQIVSDSGTSSDEADSESDSDASLRYPDPPALQKATGVSKLKHVSAGVILNRLLRKSAKKNTWIFVADTSMNLYVGIKQSGSFQHSSFINGSRISAAGLIKVKHGQLRSLSPLSGHYRPPAAAFKHFILHLKEEHVDMSRVSISKAYGVLVGLEMYLGTKSRAKAAGDKVKHGIENVVAPDKAEARREQAKDKSQSARLEEARLRELESQRGINRIVKGVREKVERMSSGSEVRRDSSAGGNEKSVDGTFEKPPASTVVAKSSEADLPAPNGGESATAAGLLDQKDGVHSPDRRVP